MRFLDISDYSIIAQAYDAAMKEHNVDIHDALNGLFVSADPLRNGADAPKCHNFTIDILPPQYASYTQGESGFTIYVNITALTEAPLKLKLKAFSVYTNGMLRTSDYIYSGYDFDEEYIPPHTTHTFGQIWITDNFAWKHLVSGEYLTLTLIEVESGVEHHIKYIYNSRKDTPTWSEESWFEVASQQ